MDPYYAANYTSSYGNNDTPSVRLVKQDGTLDTLDRVYLGGRVNCAALVTRGEGPMTVEMVSPSRRTLLYNDAAVDRVPIVYDIRELGRHALRFTFKTASRELEFSVNNPLSVRTKAQQVRDYVYLEVQVMNQSDQVMVLDQASLLPAKGLAAERVNSFADGLRPKEARQYLFILRSASRTGAGSGSETREEEKISQKEDVNKLDAKSDKEDIGKLDITWTFPRDNSTGHLQTSMLSRKITPTVNTAVYNGHRFELTMASVPDKAVQGEIFSAHVELRTDASTASLSIQHAVPTQDQQIIPIGPSKLLIESHEIRLPYVSYAKGLQALPGLKLVSDEVILDIPSIGDILVV